MEIKLIDPRLLVENPDRARRTKSSPQSDALLLATIRADAQASDDRLAGIGGELALRTINQRAFRPMQAVRQ